MQNSESNNDKDKKKKKKEEYRIKRTDLLSEKPLNINLVKITDDIIKGDPDSQEELKKKIKELKMKLRKGFDTNINKKLQNGELELKYDLNGLDKTISYISTIFKDKTWLKDLEHKIMLALPVLEEVSNISSEMESEIKQADIELEINDETSKNQDMQVKKLDIHAHQLKKILTTLKEFGIDAVKNKSYDKAIEILQYTDEKILPLIKNQGILTENDQKDVKNAILKELETALLQKGKIGAAINVIDTQCDDPLCNNHDYFTAKIKKSHLLSQKGDFNHAIDVLEEAQSKFNSLPLNGRKPKECAEIKRAFGITYRNKGSFDEALKWFNESIKDYKNIQDENGFHEALWGIGILHHLRGEWEEAITIWKSIKSYYEEKKPSDDQYKAKKFYKFYFDYTRTLQLSGNFEEAELMLNKSLSFINEKKSSISTYARAKVFLAFAELYYLQNRIDEAQKAIFKVREIKTILKNHENEINSDLEILRFEMIPEVDILRIEIQILCSQANTDKAREKLDKQLEFFTSNWEKVHYYRLLSTIEKHEMNYGEAKKALISSLEIMKEIGACTISDELMYNELLIEMSRIGNKRAYEEASRNLSRLEIEIKEKRLPALNLERKLQKGQLAIIGSSYEEAFRIFTEIVQEADTSRLYRQKTKAIEAIDSIETKEIQLSDSSREKSVFRYLDDARRILGEYS